MQEEYVVLKWTTAETKISSAREGWWDLQITAPMRAPNLDTCTYGSFGRRPTFWYGGQRDHPNKGLDVNFGESSLLGSEDGSLYPTGATVPMHRPLSEKPIYGQACLVNL
jgi:hypothetical protein